ncbi:hypothetical protein LGQ02_03420 [Bacillus shivajii]|uniref:CBO0543 family protein n=1 Tax=Bacillus shivajii TaxID=1983719 RepID=UPI001CFA8D59|nr:CBO0543 family protein [Bacillus shivajii]UCZ53847.1 hypothetical protein LGQ02_03420 [Bacillus shivajii]
MIALKLEKNILIITWIICILALIFFVPKKKIKEANVVFLFKQVMTWLFGAIVVQKKLIKYPFREFPKAIHTSFSFEYFIYPATCVLFNLKFPNRKPLPIRMGYYVLYSSILTGLEVLMERYTRLIKYVNWHWYWTWLTLCMTFFFSRMYYLWFFDKNEPLSADSNG